MQTPVAKEIQHNIMTQAAKVKAQGPVPFDDSLSKAGTAFQDSLNNAAQGFAKLYLANQRADAIQAYQDFDLELQNLREGTQIDPKTGLPAGFLNLKGDDISQSNLDEWTRKIGEAKGKLDIKLRSMVPDIRSEYELKADDSMFGATNAINGHFLKGKWEKAKDTAISENNNIIENKIIYSPDELKGYYSTFVKNHFNYTNDEKSSKLLASKDMEKLVDANVRRILTDKPEEQAYAEAKAFVRAIAGKPGYGKTTADAKLHSLDLDSGKWQLKQIGQTVDGMKEYFNNHTTHLDPLEKAVLISSMSKRKGASSGSGNDDESDNWYDIVTRFASAQEDFLSGENEFGLYLPLNDKGDIKQISNDEALQFRTDWLEFVGNIVPKLADVNDDYLMSDGLAGVVSQEYLDIAKNKSPLMRRALAILDKNIKGGSLPSMNKKQISALDTQINKLKHDEFDQHNARAEYDALKPEAKALADKADHGQLTVQEAKEAVDMIAAMKRIYGSGAVGYDEKNLTELQIKLTRAIANNMQGIFEDKDEVTLGARLAQSWHALGDTWRYRWYNPGKPYKFIDKNNKRISDWLRLSQTTKKDDEGNQSVVPAIYKTYVDTMQQMMDGGLTLVKLNKSGEPDLSAPMLKNVLFEVDGYINGKQVYSDREAFNIAMEFGKYMSQKTGDKKYENFVNIDYKSLPAEDKEYLKELTKQRFLKANGKGGYTCIDSDIDINAFIEKDIHENPIPTVSVYAGSQSGFVLPAKDKKNTPFVGPLGQSINYMDFLGGTATPEQEAVLVQQGYASVEDYTYKNGLLWFDNVSNEEMMKNNVYLMLATISPNGTFAFPGSQREESLALDKIIELLNKDNPEIDIKDYLKAGFPTYNVREDTYKEIVDLYEKIRKHIVERKRVMYYSGLKKRQTLESK